MSRQPNRDFWRGKRLLSLLMGIFILSLGIGIGTLISDRVDATGPADSQLRIETDSKPVVGDSILALSKAFEEVASRAEPTVVNINTEEVVSTRSMMPPQQDPDNPMNDWFRRFFDSPLFEMPEQQTRRSLGSGVIVDPKGYIITNHHVVEGATKIKVRVSGGDEYTAEVVGSDSVSDIAVIKISGETEFPFARIGNSKQMKVGDWVIAIGSPFGFEQTVTAGIVSATGRTFEDGGGPSLYSFLNDYLQTDAAINRGNSGGPLVNMNGEVVGINSFISSSSGSNSGVGFAVPSHLFTNVYNQILQTGKVSRGFLGVSMNTLPFTPAMAKFFGVKQGSGVLVTQLSDVGDEKGPAEKAGIQPEDVIVGFDGMKIEGVQDFRLAVANTPPNKTVKIRIVQHGKEKELEVTLAERKFEEEAKGQYSFEEKEEKPKAEIGLLFDDIPSRIAQSIDVTGGAYVLSVQPGSLAEEAGLIGEQQGAADVIVAANGKPIENAQDLLAIVKGLKSGEPVILKFIRVMGMARRQTNAPPDTAILYTSIIKP
jgi:serine protease Do